MKKNSNEYWLPVGAYCVACIDPNTYGSPIIVLRSGKGRGMTEEDVKEYLREKIGADYESDLIVLRRIPAPMGGDQ